MSAAFLRELARPAGAISSPLVRTRANTPEIEYGDSESQEPENDIEKHWPTSEQPWGGAGDGSRPDTPSTLRSLTGTSQSLPSVDRDYGSIVSMLGSKSMNTETHKEELQAFLKEKDPRVRELIVYSQLLNIRDGLSPVLNKVVMQKWEVPPEAQAELKKEIYAYLMAPECPAYVVGAGVIMLNHIEKHRVRLCLEEDVFNSAAKHKVLSAWVSRRMGDRRSAMAKAIRLSLKAGRTLVYLQKQFTMREYPFEFDISHWIRFALMRASMRKHIDAAGQRVSKGKEQEDDAVPDGYWVFLDNTIKAIKLDHGATQAEHAAFMTNVLNVELTEHDVKKATPKTVNEPILRRSVAQIQAEKCTG